MTATDYFISAKWCHENGIFIYPIVYSFSKYKLEVNTKGKKKIGEKTYAKDPKGADEKWGEVIKELYQKYYNLNFNKTKKQTK